LLADLLGQRSRPTPSEVIENRRTELGLSIEALAAKAGVNPKQVYAIKKGENVTIQTVGSVAGALGCEPGDLVQFAPSRQPGIDDSKK